MVKKLITKKNKGMIFILFLMIMPYVFGFFLNAAIIPNKLEKLEETSLTEVDTPDMDVPEISEGFTKYEWWNDTWEYRIPINVSANGAQQNDVPVEVIMNFTAHLKSLDIGNTEFDKDSIRVVEYSSLSSWVEIPCQFDEFNTPWTTYNNKTNAIGDLVWIMNGTTGASVTRNYLIYFNNNETNKKAPAPTYPTIRRFHEGFEYTEKADGDILSAAGTSQDRTPNRWGISNTTSARGERSLRIRGNCWKSIDPTGAIISIDSNTYATVKIRIDDPSTVRDISGIAFQRNGGLGSLPSQADTYEMRGWQNWGQADAPGPYGPFDDNYYAADTFFWYTLNLDDEINRNDFRYICFVADDDSPNYADIFWDDVSIWDQPVQTDPDNIPIISVGDAEPVAFTLKITVVDVDGFRVPNANVLISNISQPYLDMDDTTDANGEVLFVNVSREGTYNISVEYTQEGVTGGDTEVVYSEENYQLTELFNEKIVKANLWTINFDVSDRDGNKMDNAFVVLYNNSVPVGNESLNSGLATLIWLSQSEYNYSIFYDYSTLTDESVYDPMQLKIYNDTVSRANPSAPEYLVQQEVIDTEAERISGGATDDVRAIVTFTPQGGKTFSEFNISAFGVQDYILSLDIEEKVGQTWSNIHRYEDSGEEKNRHSMAYNNTEANQIRVTMVKENYTAANGTIRIRGVESTDVVISTKVSSVRFNISDNNRVELENAILKIYNKSESTILASLKVDEDGFATFYGFNNDTKKWGNYSLLIEFASTEWTFGPPPDAPSTWDYGPGDPYNFTFDTTMNITLLVNLNIENYVTNLTLTSQNPADFLTDIYWRDNISIEFIFETNDTTDLDPAEKDDPDTVTLQFLDEDFGVYGSPIDLIGYRQALGNFSFTFNSSDYSLKGGNTYYMRITATKSGYTDPEAILKTFVIQEVLTDYKIVDPTTLEEISSYTLTKYWNTTTTLLLSINETISNDPVKGASLTYSWEYGSGSVYEDLTKGAGYYNFTIDTGDATDTTTETITFSFTKEHYADPTGTALRFDIINRPTTLNGNSDVSYLSEKIYVDDAQNFSFYYKDVLTSNFIKAADQKAYTWQKLDADGDPIEGDTGVGALIELPNGTYIMDLDTENFEVGVYFIFLTIEKDFHDDKDAILNLEVEKRLIDTDFSANFDIKDSKVEIIKGDEIEFELELTDPTQDDIALEGAKVILTIGEEEWEFDEKDDGLYVLTFSSAEYDALFTAQTLTGEITIEKSDYEDETIEITIVVNMEEVFPGMPASYFYMIVGAIVAVVGSLIVYNAIQKSKIPKFVKRANAMKGAIKSRKNISESLLYPPKNEEIVKMFKDEWELLGISLEDIMGVSRKKGKAISDAKKQPGGGVD